MPPGHELNDRFHGYIRRARRTRRLVVGSLLVTCLVGASGFALEMAPPDALATLKRGMASVGENVSGALASVSNIPSLASQQLAATAASGIGDTIFRIVCTILRNCPSESEVPPPTPQPQRALTQTTNPYPSNIFPECDGDLPSTYRHQDRNTADSADRNSATSHRTDPGNGADGDRAGRRCRLRRRPHRGAHAVAAIPDRGGALGEPDDLPNVGMAARVENLDGVNITNATITGGAISGVSLAVEASGVSGTLTNAIESAIATITDLTSTTITATNATFTNATSTNFAATTAGTTNLTTGSLTVGSATGILRASSGVVSAITNGVDGTVLKLVGGTPTWSTDLQGSGGGSSAWATSTDELSVSPSDTSDVIIIGSNATTTTGSAPRIMIATLITKSPDQMAATISLHAIAARNPVARCSRRRLNDEWR